MRTGGSTNPLSGLVAAAAVGSWRLTFWLTICLVVHSAAAASQLMSIGMDASLSNASSIVVGRLVSLDVGPIVTGQPYMAGTYTFDVIRSITANLDGRFTINVPGFGPMYYGGKIPPIAVGDDYLLLMRRDSSGQLQVTNPPVPLIYLRHYIPDPIAPKAPRDLALSIIAATLEDPKLRMSSIGLLEQARYAPLIPLMLRLARDPDWRIQDSALCFLAYNEVESAIPQIVQFARAARENDRDGRCVVALRWYSSSSAIQCLSPLLISPEYELRSNVADTIRNVPTASLSSLPYLMISLMDPDPQMDIPHQACETIHRIIPDLGPSDDWHYFLAHQQREIDDLHAWWALLLAGRPCAGSTEYIGWIRTLQQSKPGSMLLLYSPVKLDRERAVQRIARMHDRSTVPYLLLALNDPDEAIAYTAYVTLSQLLPGALAPTAVPAFAGARGKITNAAYQWWRDELSGKHS